MANRKEQQSQVSIKDFEAYRQGWIIAIWAGSFGLLSFTGTIISIFLFPEFNDLFFLANGPLSIATFILLIVSIKHLAEAYDDEKMYKRFLKAGIIWIIMLTIIWTTQLVAPPGQYLKVLNIGSLHHAITHLIKAPFFSWALLVVLLVLYVASLIWGFGALFRLMKYTQNPLYAVGMIYPIFLYLSLVIQGYFLLKKTSLKRELFNYIKQAFHFVYIILLCIIFSLAYKDRKFYIRHKQIPSYTFKSLNSCFNS